MSITVVILTKNEELHIGRALNSVQEFASRCVVVDSGSSDRTVAIAREAGAEVLVNPFQTQAQQFNWALDQLPESTEWILRLDADEFVTEKLRSELIRNLPALPYNIAGVWISRRMKFLGKQINWGGVFPVRIIRLFRFGKGRSENRWMDEHITVDGPVADFKGAIIDDNLNNLTWWTEKHNRYASRQVVDILDNEYQFSSMPRQTAAPHIDKMSWKRWAKENVYGRLPIGVRAFFYFLYRYILRLGFLDGREGAAFHVLQGFWYRYLVDLKLSETKNYMKREGVGVIEAIDSVLGIKVE